MKTIFGSQMESPHSNKTPLEASLFFVFLFFTKKLLKTTESATKLIHIHFAVYIYVDITVTVLLMKTVNLILRRSFTLTM